MPLLPSWRVTFTVLSPSMALAMFRGPSGWVYSGMGTAVLNACTGGQQEVKFIEMLSHEGIAMP